MQDKLFNFNLEVQISLKNANANKNIYLNVKRKRESTIHISEFDNNKNDKKKHTDFQFYSEMQILKEIKSDQVPIGLLYPKLKYGNTIIDRIQGIISIRQELISK